MCFWDHYKTPSLKNQEIPNLLRLLEEVRLEKIPNSFEEFNFFWLKRYY